MDEVEGVAAECPFGFKVGDFEREEGIGFSGFGFGRGLDVGEVGADDFGVGVLFGPGTRSASLRIYRPLFFRLPRLLPGAESTDCEGFCYSHLNRPNPRPCS